MTEESRFAELAARAAKAGRTGYTHFLEPSFMPAAKASARANGVKVEFFGGYSQAERVIAAFLPQDGIAEFPITVLEITWNAKFAQAGHRDILGAVMGLSIGREVTGDIVIAGADKAYLMAETDMAGYIIANLESAGRAKLRIAVHEGEIEYAEPEGLRIRITLASPRLDAFVSAGYDLSRNEAQKLIAAGLVKLNHVPELRGDVRVNANDLISARGYGRMRIEEMLGETRRGRLAARVFKYGAK